MLAYSKRINRESLYSAYEWKFGGVLIDSRKLAMQMEFYLEGLIREGRIRLAGAGTTPSSHS